MLSWFTITMDDLTNKYDLATFQKHYSTGQPQVDPFFDYFIAHTNKVWDYYHPLVASPAVSCVIEFASICHLEDMTEGMKINSTSARYADYLRRKSGMSDFYSFGLWPAAQFPDIKAFMQAVPAISHFTSEFGSELRSIR